MSEPPSPETAVRYPRIGGDGAERAVYIGHFKDGWKDAYHFLLTMPLGGFFGVMACGYLLVNTVFALVYLVIGGISGVGRGDFADAFFFSAETFSTVGFGQLAPQSFAAHIAVTVESFCALFNLAAATGLLFARISRPTARVLFSDRAVVASEDGVPTLMFRAANRRRNRIVEAEVNVTLLRDGRTLEGATYRRFETLNTVRAKTPVFLLTWTVMHRIDETSPLFGETMESLFARRAEIVVVLKGLDETFAQTIHARASYTPDEIAWGSRLVDIFSRREDGRTVIDYTHFHDIV
jgi:inward rectifier potassium channel